MKKNILIISIYYPPIQSIASNRIYSFAKYLNRDKYNVFVHTIDEGKAFTNDLKDVSVSRVKNRAFFKPLTFPSRTNKVVHYSKVIYNKIVNKFTKNIYQSWIDESYELLKLKIKEENIDLILSSFAPDASHLVVLRLKKEFPHLKWIADMRDEMSFSPYIDATTKTYYEALEQQIFKYANALTSVSRPLLCDFSSMCKNEKVLFGEIRNGYDFSLEEEELRNKIFTITYTGNFYGDINPINFFRALELFVSNNQGVQLKVQLVGVKTHFEIPSTLRELVEVIPPVQHEKAIEFMKQSDALLLIYPTNGRKGVYTGKLFEYIGSLTPIIALIDEEDVASKLIQKVGAGYVSDNNDIEKIEELLMLSFTDWKNKKKRKVDLDMIKQHHRYEQVQRLEYLIDKILDEK